MTIPVQTKNTMLDGQVIDRISLHSGFPGTTGANELTGGSPAYARKNCTVAAASGGQRLLSSAVLFDVPATTVRWLGFWNSTTFVATAPNGGAVPKNFMADPTTDLIHAVSHGYADTDTIVFFNGTPPGGLTEGTVYFVRDATANTFKVAATSGGAAIDLTAAASFGCVMCAIVQDVYAVQGFHSINTATFAIPD